jgi:t-SNARE complex subunit (syntaxin)
VVEGRALTALSETAESEEAHATAVKLGQEALAVHRLTGHRPGEARTLLALARAHRKTDGAAAELMRQQAWDIFSDIGVPAKEYKDLAQ